MMQLILITFLMMNTFFFTLSNHPMSMGLILLFQTLLICLFTGLMTKSFWFSYMLFLIFIGGMLILFIYMSSLASNEKIQFSTNFFKILIIPSLMMILLFMDKFYLINFFKNMEINDFFNWHNLMKENSLTISKMYDSPNNFIIIMLVNYLLLTLIMTVKITNTFHGPLRPKHFY